MFGGVSNSSSSAQKSEIDQKIDNKQLPPDPNLPLTSSSPGQTNDQIPGGEKYGGNGSSLTLNESTTSSEKKRRSGGVGSKASSLLASAKNTLNFSQSNRSNSDMNTQTSLQKLGKQDPALAIPQGQYNNSAGESAPTSRSTFKVGVWEDRNKKCRRTMEDTHAFLYNFLDTPMPTNEGAPGKDRLEKHEPQETKQRPVETDNGYFAIFDGHAGTFAADWCGKKLHIILEDTIRRNPNVAIPELLDQTFTAVDAQLEKLPLKHSGCTAAIAILRWEDRVVSDRSVASSLAIAPAAAIASKGVDSSQLEKDKSDLSETSRTLVDETAIARLKNAATKQRVLYTANVGDARIILCRGGKALRLSYDHKGSDENEGKRIANAGGLILNNRVNGVLAVTRALGDTYMKDLVTGHPYTTETVIQPDMDEFIIIACDGLWDVCSDQEAVDLVRDIQDPNAASKLLVGYALDRFSTDNLSCMIIRLDQEAHIQRQKRQTDPTELGTTGKTSTLSETDIVASGMKQTTVDGTISPASGFEGNGGCDDESIASQHKGPIFATSSGPTNGIVSKGKEPSSPKK